MFRKNSISSVIMLILAAVVWGGSFVVVKDSLNYVTPMWQLVLRLAVASAAGVVVFLTQLQHICKKYIGQGVILGILFALALIFQNFGADLSTASKCAFLTVSYVAFIPIIGVVFLKKHLTIKKILTVVVCMTGVGCITLNEKLSMDIGDLLLLATGFCYALHILWIDHCSESDGVIVIHIIQIWTALIIALCMAMIAEPFCISYEKSFVMSMMYCGIFEVLLGFFLQFKGQQKTSPSLAGIILSSECVFAGLFGFIFQGDKFSLKMMIGCALIFASAVIESLKAERNDQYGS
ncbi:MAG: DMT family transporter [Lachnospiraceae bacterium]